MTALLLLVACAHHPQRPGPLVGYACDLGAVGERCWLDVCRELRHDTITSAPPLWWVQASDGWWLACGGRGQVCAAEVVTGVGHCGKR